MIVLIGESGSGKTSVENILCNEYNYERIISYTTRDPRLEEINHESYHFITRNEFEQLVDSGFFVEFAEYNENLYGTAKEDCGVNKVLVVESQGLLQLQNIKNLNILSFYLSSPELTRYIRMSDRGDDLKKVFSRIRNDRTAFKGVEKNVDYIIDNNTYTDLNEIAVCIDEIYQKFKITNKKKGRKKNEKV
jgi:guanylate kinase